jgi:hypothetical protein
MKGEGKSRELVFKHPDRNWKSGSLKASDIVKNKRGTYVPRKKSLASQDRFYGRGKYKGRDVSGARVWIDSVQKAKRELNIPANSFVAIGGKSPQGQELLQRARSIHAKARSPALLEKNGGNAAGF